VRFPAEWREAIRYLTALRSLEVGASSWQFVTDTPYLSWVGRWFSRRDEMRRLEVLVDDQVVTALDLADATQDETLCLFAGLGGGLHHIQIYFPATSTLELGAIDVKPGARLTPLSAGVRWCSWGDSITQGTLCPSSQDSYVQRAARSLGWTAINRGFGGAGFPDPMTALAIADSEPWDVLTIAVGINSVLKGRETPAEFGLMYRSCLEILGQRCPGQPVVCISPLVCARQTTDLGDPLNERLLEIRQATQAVVEEMATPNVHFVDGFGMLDGGAALEPDQVHPGPHGHRQMAARLIPVLERLTRRNDPSNLELPEATCTCI
jgi:lysophospholipase L1-like esterase